MLEQIENYSPMMRKYLETKQKYQDCILFYRLGDFYEMFFDDAINVSKELELTLTGRECGTKTRAPMCGVPYHSAQTYIDKLIKNGHKVAICEQLEDPKQAKGIVQRGVTRIITPRTAIDYLNLEEKKSNYIMSIIKIGIYYGLSVLDVTTGEFKTTKIRENYSFEKLLDEISRYNPKEIVVNKALLDSKIQIIKIQQKFECYISLCNEKSYSDKFQKEFLNKKLRTFNIFVNDKIADVISFCDNKEYDLELFSIYSLLDYINETQKINLEHINKIEIYSNIKYMILDINARKSLELTSRLKDGSKKGTLLWVLDKTKTAMGGRLLNRWINDPLIDKEQIIKRQDSVEELINDLIKLNDLCEILSTIYDIERICGKISYKNVSPKDLVSLKNSIEKLPKLKEILSNSTSEYLVYLFKKLDCMEDIFELIDKAIVNDPPMVLKDGEIIKKGYNSKLDELKLLANDSKQYLTKIELDEREKTGIKNLKISYNKVFGYYFEVTKSNLNQVPDYFIRKQTLSNSERYITQELKQLEENILNAKSQIDQIEYDEFTNIREQILKEVKRIQNTSNIVAILDCICSFAKVANEYEYTKPEIISDDSLEIVDGFHPVISRILGDNSFIPNNTKMEQENFFHIITGPNMAGKSTYMRQVALIVLMAQIGSFVPAKYAKIPIVDRIMTRVGAQDDLSMGESTFMVEMMEVANILKNATSKSLLILDEIGRGTSTYDGMAIAHSVISYIVNNIGSKTLFATHYHELTQMDKISGIKNYHVCVKENGEDIVFLRKIKEGGTDESFGIHVAKLARIPDKALKEARKILNKLEKKSVDFDTKEEKHQSNQIDLFNMNLVQISEELNNINLDEITPIKALNVLAKLKELNQ